MTYKKCFEKWSEITVYGVLEKQYLAPLLW